MPVSIDFSSYYTFGYASRTQLKHAKHDQRHELKQNLAENLRTGVFTEFFTGSRQWWTRQRARKVRSEFSWVLGLGMSEHEHYRVNLMNPGSRINLKPGA
jgi:hypothetical protein